MQELSLSKSILFELRQPAVFCWMVFGEAPLTQRGAHAYLCRILFDAYVFFRPSCESARDVPALRCRAIAFVDALENGTLPSLWADYVEVVDDAAKAGEDDDVDWLAEAELDYDGIVPPPMPNLTCGDR